MLIPLTDDRLKARLAQNERLIITLYKHLFDSGLHADQLISLGQVIEQADRRIFRKCLAFVQGCENQRLRVGVAVLEEVADLLPFKPSDKTVWKLTPMPRISEEETLEETTRSLERKKRVEGLAKKRGKAEHRRNEKAFEFHPRLKLEMTMNYMYDVYS